MIRRMLKFLGRRECADYFEKLNLTYISAGPHISKTSSELIVLVTVPTHFTVHMDQNHSP